MSYASHRVAVLLLAAGLLAGCSSAHRPVVVRTTTELTGLNLQVVDSVVAQCAPPVNWKPDPLKQDDRHTHQVWISPSGRTAYGVIHFKLPLPVGTDMVLWAFMRQMKHTEGEATLLDKESDPRLPGLRFEAEGGKYKIRVNLITHGFEGWAIYAGTLRSQPIDPDELKLAEKAREMTVTGVPVEASAD